MRMYKMYEIIYMGGRVGLYFKNIIYICISNQLIYGININGLKLVAYTCMD